ncbi:MAG: dihydrolipoamide acetyltransferase family protein [Chloroflexi bacterium]|nr:dihydrolipoamide acetyltransferase family protein [Chloroflexota bacterium]
MSFEIKMPHVGESVTEAVVGKWLKQPGDRIEKYEPIVEVVTDKVAMEVPAPASGELTKIIADEGETIAMGTVIAEMSPDDVSVLSASPARREAAVTASEIQPRKTPGPVATPRPSGLRIASGEKVGTLITGANVGPTGGAFQDTSLGASTAATQSQSERSNPATPTITRLSPVVQKLLDQHGIDPSKVTGTGVGGRITRSDVQRYVDDGGAKNTPVVTTPGTVIKPSPVRRMIADHMSHSFREIPHAWSAVEVDVSGIVACRAANRESVQANYGLNLTYLPFTLAVTASALRSNPLLNSSWTDEGILQYDKVNVGIAVAGKGGLVVPVVRDADARSVLELAQDLNGLVERAREGRLTLEDVSGGTFTLNNTGALGSVWGGAIINPPQAAILTTEAIFKRPIVVTRDSVDSVEIRPMMNICLSFDHRVIDGAQASAFLQAMKRGLEQVAESTPLE